MKIKDSIILRDLRCGVTHETKLGKIIEISDTASKTNKIYTTNLGYELIMGENL